MLSNSSLKSKWTKREVYYAEGEDKRIVPILIDGQRLRGWFKFHFGNVDFVDIQSEEQKAKLINNLRTWLGVEVEAESETKVDNPGRMNPEDAILALAKSTGIKADTIRKFLRKSAHTEEVRKSVHTEEARKSAHTEEFCMPAHTEEARKSAHTEKVRKPVKTEEV